MKKIECFLYESEKEMFNNPSKAKKISLQKKNSQDKIAKTKEFENAYKESINTYNPPLVTSGINLAQPLVKFSIPQCTQERVHAHRNQTSFFSSAAVAAAIFASSSSSRMR